MKKLLSLVCAMLICAIAAFTFVACEKENTTPEEQPEHKHDYEQTWANDETHHWHVCKDTSCSSVSDKKEHNWNDGEITTPATPTAAGVKTFTCADCGKTKTEEITHEHVYETEFSSDETHHWYACDDDACQSVSEKEEHTWDNGVLTAYATPSKEGVITYTCSVCEGTKDSGFAFEGTVVNNAAELIAALENGGNIALSSNIEISAKLSVMKNTVILGCGNTLTYTGSDRAIDVPADSNGANLTIVDLTINSTASWCERGVNYNTSGTLLLEKVTITATNQNYAVNLPGKSDNAKVIINNSKITSFIALNVWGENTNVVINDSELYSIGNSAELGGGISVNVDSTNRADHCSITINGGKLISLYVDGTTPALAIRNYANDTSINISAETEVIGEIRNSACVATVSYPPSYHFYAFTSLEDAVKRAATDVANGSSNTVVVLMCDVTVESLEVPGSVTIDLNGHNLTITNITGEKDSLTITGNGTFNGTQQ